MATKKSEKDTKVDDSANAGLRYFRNSSEVQSLYQFIHQNNLRREAMILFSKLTAVLSPKKKRNQRKK